MAKENSSLIFCQLALHVSLRSPSWIPGPETKNRDVSFAKTDFWLFFTLFWIHIQDMRLRTALFILMRIRKLLMRLMDPDPCSASYQSDQSIPNPLRLHSDLPKPWSLTLKRIRVFTLLRIQIRSHLPKILRILIRNNDFFINPLPTSGIRFSKLGKNSYFMEKKTRS
jgi:hypothetical protein